MCVEPGFHCADPQCETCKRHPCLAGQEVKAHGESPRARPELVGSAALGWRVWKEVRGRGGCRRVLRALSLHFGKSFPLPAWRRARCPSGLMVRNSGAV